MTLLNKVPNNNLVSTKHTHTNHLHYTYKPMFQLNKQQCY